MNVRRGWNPLPGLWCGRCACGVALVLSAAALGQGAAAPAPGQGAAPPAEAAARPGEPAVSPADAQLLAAAAEIAREDPARAAAHLRSQLTAESGAMVPFAAAGYSLQAGRDAEAVGDLEEAVRRAPSFARARLNLAKVLLRLERPGEAAGHLRHLLREQAPDPAEVWRLLAFALLAEGHAPAAEAAYCQALVWDPQDAELISGLLKSLLDQGRGRDAAPIARAQLQLHPEDPRWWSLLANSALDAGEPRQAIVFLDCSRRLGVATPDMLAALGDLYIDQGLYRAAAETYAAAAGAPPPPERLLRAAEALVHLQQADEAARLLEAASERSSELTPPQQVAADRLRARLALQGGRPDRARSILAGLLSRDPLDGEALLLMAETVQAQDPAAAREYYGRAASLKGWEVRALTGLARLETAQGRLAEALGCLQKALAFGHDARLREYYNQVLEAAQAQTQP